MKKYFVLMVFLMGSLAVFAQPEPDETKGEIFDVVEESPEFPGGMQELYKFIGSNFHYPDTCIKLNVQGRIYVSLVVEKDGSIGETRIIRGLHPELDAEALRVVRMMPKWTPGRQRGIPVRVRYNIPILCKLS